MANRNSSKNVVNITHTRAGISTHRPAFHIRSDVYRVYLGCNWRSHHSRVSNITTYESPQTCHASIHYCYYYYFRKNAERNNNKRLARQHNTAERNDREKLTKWKKTRWSTYRELLRATHRKFIVWHQYFDRPAVWCWLLWWWWWWIVMVVVFQRFGHFICYFFY